MNSCKYWTAREMFREPSRIPIFSIFPTPCLEYLRRIKSRRLSKRLIASVEPFFLQLVLLYLPPSSFPRRILFYKKWPISKAKSHLVGCINMWREDFPGNSGLRLKDCFWIVSSRNLYAFQSCVDLPKSFRALSTEKWCWKSQVPTLGCVRMGNERHVQWSHSQRHLATKRGSDFYGITEREKRTSHTRGESTFQLIDGRAYAPRALDVIDVKRIAAHRLYQDRNAPSGKVWMPDYSM